MLNCEHFHTPVESSAGLHLLGTKFLAKIAASAGTLVARQTHGRSAKPERSVEV